MAQIPNPQSELLREPNLLMPGKKPVGSVKIDRTTYTGQHIQHFLLPPYTYDISKQQPITYGSTMETLISDAYHSDGLITAPGGGSGSYLIFPQSTGHTYKAITILMSAGRYASHTGDLSGNFTGGNGEYLFRTEESEFRMKNDAGSSSSVIKSGVGTPTTAFIYYMNAAKWDGSNIYAYTNDSKSSASAFTGTVTPSVPLRVGRNTGSGVAFTSACGFCVIFDIALSDEQLNEYYRNFTQDIIPA